MPAPSWPDPGLIAELANAFFKAPNPGPVLSADSPGLPIVPPPPALIPAPSAVTTVAPHAPAAPPFGPPDLPTTIASVVPTPNLAAPAMPSRGEQGAWGIPDVPQPGASAGAFAPTGPTEFEPPKEFGDFTGLVPPAHRDGSAPDLARAPSSYYFVSEAAARVPSRTASFEAPSSAPAVPAAPTPREAAAPQAPSALYFMPDAAAPARAPTNFETPAFAPDASSGVPAGSPASITDAPHRGVSAPPPVSPPIENVPDREARNYAGSGPRSALASAVPTSPDLQFPGEAFYFLSEERQLHRTEAVPQGSAGFEPKDLRPELAPDLGSATRPLDHYSIKRDFPILRERVHGRPLVWLDNAATTQKPQVVIDRLAYYYEHENSNVHRAAHALAARATDAYEGARDTVRRFLNASSAQDIVFVRGTTEAINLVAKSWGARYVGPGDEIVITWLEHHANIVPWQQLCADKGACLRVAPVDDRGQVILEQYERLLGPRTRLVAFSQVSNALGTIAPAQPMIEMAHRHGALVLVDGAQAVSHMRVDVQALDCDFYCFSGHKVFAPTGIGALYGKPDVLSSMPPWQGGGNMISNVTFEKTSYQPPPQRFEAGTSSIGDAVGLGAALDYVSSLGMENISRYEHELLVYATEGLERVPGLRLIGTAPDKAAVLSFVLDGVRTEDVGTALDQEGIAVRSGHHCAQPILRRFGLESTVRASLAPYNTREDNDALVAALLRLQAGRPQLRAAG